MQKKFPAFTLQLLCGRHFPDHGSAGLNSDSHAIVKSRESLDAHSIDVSANVTNLPFPVVFRVCRKKIT